MEKHFEFLKFLIVNDKLPKVSLLSGEKGIGKSTLVNHLMYFTLIKIIMTQKNILLLKKVFFINNI